MNRKQFILTLTALPFVPSALRALIKEPVAMDWSKPIDLHDHYFTSIETYPEKFVFRSQTWEDTLRKLGFKIKHIKTIFGVELREARKGKEVYTYVIAPEL